MSTSYYQRELTRLRELGADFARAHPALAPLLSGDAADPDVERLLEGSAFLSGMIRQKLDDEMPEIIHALLNVVAPHYLRPIPAATMLVFTPRKALRECLPIARGTAVDSVPVEGTPCTFTTCDEIHLAPLSIVNATLTRHGAGQGGGGVLRLDFHCDGVPLANLTLPALRLTFGGAYAQAAMRFALCMTQTRELRLSSPGSPVHRLPPSALRPAGFAREEALLPYPPQSFSGFRLLQEYYVLPERFCAVDVTGFDQWQNRGTGADFSLEWELDKIPDEMPPFRAEHVQLFVASAVNLFAISGAPIELDHRRAAYPLRPLAKNTGHFQTYAVTEVSGFSRNTQNRRKYQPFMEINPTIKQEAVYSISVQQAADTDLTELWLSVAYAQGSTPSAEVLSTELLCTNANLPEALRTGDIRNPTSTSPELATFSNLRPPTAPVQPPVGANTLWRLLSHLYLNYLSVANAENLQSLLKLYIFNKTKDRASVLANISRVEGIVDLRVQPEERFVRDRLVRGLAIRLVLREDHFAGPGDMYVFGSVLNVFFSNYAAINTYTRLIISDVQEHRSYEWPCMTGDRPLL